jgi:hypothetical protein
MPQIPLYRDQLTEDDVLACFTPEDRYLSRAQIAERLGVRKHGGVIKLIERCVERGTLRRFSDVLANRAGIFLYERV